MIQFLSINFSASQSRFLKMRIYLLFFVFLLSNACSEKTADSKKEYQTLFVGSFTTPNEQGIEKADSIYILQMDRQTGELSRKGAVTNVSNPSYLAIHPNKKYLYAAERPNGKTGFGWVSAYNIEGDTPEKVDSVSSQGYGACYVSVAPNGVAPNGVDYSGKFVLLANYFEAVASFGIGQNGSLTEALSVKKHQRSSVSTLKRQETAHPHMILPTLESNMAFVPDLGLDSIFHYRISNEGVLQLQAQTATAEGAGPRHMTFHPNKKWVYVLNELNRTVGAFHIKSLQEPFELVQTIPTLKNDDAQVTAAAIHLHPNGKFLYTSNRGLNGSTTQSISVFQIHPESGELTLVQEQNTKGKIPRDFAISPDGKFLLVANQDTDDIFTFQIDAVTGKLEDTGFSLKVTAPVCLKFL